MSEPSSEGDVESPCVSICELKEDEICLGCGRSIDEIVEWGSASFERRRQINLIAASRRNDINPVE